MARDAAARQSDVETKSVKLVVETDSGRYRPGTITFAARKGGSIDLDKLQADLQKTRLGGRTNMEVKYLEITATGQVVAADKGPYLLKVAGTSQQFLLGEDPKLETKEGEKSALARLREAQASGKKVIRVTGRVQGWSGRFPVVLKALAEDQKKGPDRRKPPLLFVRDFQIARE